MSMRIGIVGAGLAGRLLALECLQRGFSITLFDQDTMAGKKSCGWTAAGMVAPYTELESCEPLVFKLGIETLQIWPTILQQLTQPVSAKFLGTLVVAHPQDVAELARFRMIIQHKLQRHSDINSKVLTTLSREKLESFEPGLSPKIREGYWMPEEGSIDNVEFFYATTAFLQTHPQVTWLEKTKVTALQPHCIQVNDQEYIFDLVPMRRAGEL